MTARPVTILIVDADRASRSEFTATLESAGFEVLLAATEYEARAYLDRNQPDLILTDARQQAEAGFSFCRQLKATPAWTLIPLIFTTQASRTEDVVEALSIGGVDYIVRPVAAPELIARVKAHLATARMTRNAWVALDAIGRPVVAVDAKGRLLWHTPKAAPVLERVVPLGQAVFGFKLFSTSQRGADIDFRLAGNSGGRLEAVYLGARGAEHYFKLDELNSGDEVRQLSAALNLTSREGEVLLWVARGKTTQDISEILKISPRTVTKHLEQIYPKMGVDNRATAVARATRVAAGWRQ